jgi:hypothetical protein
MVGGAGTDACDAAWHDRREGDGRDVPTRQRGRLGKALGQCGVSPRAVRDLTERLPDEYAAWRTRAISGCALASLCLDTGYAPLRRWGSKTGVLWVWDLWGDGRPVRLTLSSVHSESQESCLEVVRDLVQRDLQTPRTITT